MVEVNTDLDPGDETRHDGDYVGFPHAVADETARSDLTGTGDEPLEGKPVTYDGTDIAEATADADDIVGILYTYQYYGDSSYGPFVRGDRDATVKIRGSVIADLSDWGGTAPSVGTYLDDNATVFVAGQSSENSDHYEVILR